MKTAIPKKLANARQRELTDPINFSREEPFLVAR